MKRYLELRYAALHCVPPVKETGLDFWTPDHDTWTYVYYKLHCDLIQFYEATDTERRMFLLFCAESCK